MLAKRDANNWVMGRKVASGVWSQTYGEEVTFIPVCGPMSALPYPVASLPSFTFFGADSQHARNNIMPIRFKSSGCLISIVISVALTVALNAMLWGWSP